jgi:hypothetical protein
MSLPAALRLGRLLLQRTHVPAPLTAAMGAPPRPMATAGCRRARSPVAVASRRRHQPAASTARAAA